MFDQKMKTLKKTYRLELPDSLIIETDTEKSYREILEEYQPKKLGNALAVRINGNLFDLSQKVRMSGLLEVISFKDEAGKEIFWHSSAHVLAQAIKRIYPETQLTIGPVTRHGPGFFYYDIHLNSHKISQEDFPRIEAEMHHIVKEGFKISRHVYETQEAVNEFKEMGEHFKARIIARIPENESITLYRQGEFQDLCRGPHVPSTDKLGYFKITAVSGAYWKGDPTQPMLQRIYAVSFPTEKELKRHLDHIEEVKKRDHRKLGRGA